ncbi:MAG: hypothetical protein CBC25_02915 [Pelagibacteraceae bacterium TMED65]|nr:hypothetical protein [Rickettsiales bacterium]OUU52498.1 MAG: hypothetical protein CBC25_02915 [Pelagibacteraceae bacterium TMED65]
MKNNVCKKVNKVHNLVESIMKYPSYQLDFDFSRPLDIQRNTDLGIIDNCITNFSGDTYSELFKRHLRLLVLELYFSWSESSSQFLTVSMSKRGYNCKSRYNPNRISSYLIRIVNYLRDNKYIEVYPGFYDSKTRKSRRTRIRPSEFLINHFQRIKDFKNENYNHLKREFMFVYDKNNLFEYKDTYESGEIRGIMKYYNTLISKTLFDIPTYENNYLTRGDNRKLVISKYSTSNYLYDRSSPSKPLINGCWWNKIDLKIFLQIKNEFTINNNSTSYLNLLDFFGDFLSFISNTNIVLQPRSFSSVLNYDQLCYLIIKSFRSKNSNSFLKSVFNEKKKLDLVSFTNNEIKDAISNHILKNQRISDFIFRYKNIGWDQFTSIFFYNLIKKLSSVNIPIYLVRDKVYFPTSMESIVLEKSVQILEKKLNIKSININSNKSLSIDFKKRGIFGKFTKPKIKYSKRYLDNKKFFGIN